MPEIARSVVLLPAPLAPISVTIWFSADRQRHAPQRRGSCRSRRGGCGCRAEPSRLLRPSPYFNAVCVGRCRDRPRSPAGRFAPRRRVPSAILTPWSSTLTRSEMPITTRIECSISRMVTPRSSRTRRTKSIMSRAFARIHAGHRLVEQQQPRPGGERPADLQPALLAIGEIARHHVAAAAQADEVQNPQRLLMRLAPRRAASPAVLSTAPIQVDLRWICMPTRMFSIAVRLRNRRMF